MRIIKLIVSFLAIATFAGCASKAHKEDVVYSGPAVRLRPAPGSTADASAASRQSQAGALGYVNARRAEVGLPGIAVDPGLETAARDHARYLLLNRVGTHDEVEGWPGFTGADILTRVRLHTQAHSASEVLAMLGSSQAGSSPVEHIFASPYHRGALLFDWARAGEGTLAGSGAVTVVDFADIARSLGDDELIAWPYDGQTRVPVAWMNNEQPDPMGPDSGYRGQVLGYPVTLSGGPNAHIELQSVDVRDARGDKVPCRIAPLTAADTARNTAVCTPYAPLTSDTRYTVHARGTLRQLTVRSRFDLSWTFTTSRVPATMPPAADAVLDFRQATAAR